MDLDRWSEVDETPYLPPDGSDFPPVDEGVVEPPPPPGPGPERGRQAQDGWLTRSPWWFIPVLVSAVLGVERVLLFAFSPGDMEFAMIGWGVLLAVSLAGAMLWGGILMDRAQRADREDRGEAP
jgi:hypothetical protein